MGGATREQIKAPNDEAQLKKEFRKRGDKAHEIELTGQARANVLFEGGWRLVGTNVEPSWCSFGDSVPSACGRAAFPAAGLGSTLDRLLN